MFVVLLSNLEYLVKYISVSIDYQRAFDGVDFISYLMTHISVGEHMPQWLIIR